MGVLKRSEILAAVEAGDITIDPFAEAHVGANSVDLTLSPDLIRYEKRSKPPHYHAPLDCRDPQYPTVKVPELKEHGQVTLLPGTLYLASTAERTFTPKHVPVIWGKGTLGRLGLNVHCTAGFGDVGFDGHWTLGLFCVHPVRIYAGQKIAQLVFFDAVGDG